ncbi:ATP-grasp domain-containing protein [Streptomyces rubellomurinus]|uniref:ATP-grasp domain-containing protein n=1 Tax=Streptomyces rubellomurinus (strain ATCC 31215) TaxID=359131 RepID=UPI0005F15CDC|nr:ATP-grasp domain-containing protein [Streptomyces rubellomurinus]
MNDPVGRATRAGGGGERLLVVGWRTLTTAHLEELGCEVTWVMQPSEVAAARQSGFTGRIVTVTDHTSVEQLLAALARHGLTPEAFTAVGTDHEFALVATAAVTALSGVRGVGPRTAVLLRDKYAQKQALRAAGVHAADAAVVDDLAELLEPPLPFPVVVKPLLGASTQDTWALRERADVEALLKERGERRWGPWCVEEFMPGRELEMDGVVRDGEVVSLTVSRYLANLIALKDGALVGALHLDRAEHPRVYAQAEALVSRALDVLGHRDGVFHLEAFDQGDRLAFSECGGRTGGGLVREALEAKNGLALMREWARALAGLPFAGPAGPHSELCYGWVQLPAPLGRVESAPTAAELLELEGVVRATVDIAPGREMADLTTGSHIRGGRVLVGAPTEQDTERCLYQAAAWFADRVVVAPRG